MDPRAARAEAAAAKARAKSMRPWYRKKRYLLPLALVVLIGISVAASGGGDDKDTNTASDGVTSKLSTNDEHPPKDDVTITACESESEGFASADLQVVNHSSKRSNYTIEITFERDGVKIGTGNAFLTSVEPDQTSVDGAIGSITGPSDGMTCRLVNVERFAS
jgi:hypothetical protein